MNHLNNNKGIEDVIKYLYGEKKEELAIAVLDLTRRCERAEAEKYVPTNTPDTTAPHHYHNGIICYQNPCYWAGYP